MEDGKDSNQFVRKISAKIQHMIIISKIDE
jgi:hypothetical protein